MIVDRDKAFTGEVIKFILRTINWQLKLISPFNHDGLKRKGRYNHWIKEKNTWEEREKCDHCLQLLQLMQYTAASAYLSGFSHFEFVLVPLNLAFPQLKKCANTHKAYLQLLKEKANFITASPRPAKTSGWSSVWRRQTSWAKTYQHHQSSPLTTMSSKSFTNSHTLGPPSPITSPLTLRLTRGLGRQPQHSLAWHQECGQTPSWLWRWRWLCTMPVSSAPCSMAARHGPHMPVRREGSTLSTLEAYNTYSASHGKTRWPTLMSCLMLASPPCTPCWDNIGCTGLAMAAIWRMAKFQKMSSTVSLPQGREALDACSWGTRMCARETWRHSTSTSIPGRTLPPTAPAGEACFTNSCRLAKRSWQWQQQRSEPAKRKQQPTDQSQCTDVTYLTKIATLILVSTATGGTAQAEQTAWTSNRWIIIIHGQPWWTEAYNTILLGSKTQQAQDRVLNSSRYHIIEIFFWRRFYIFAHTTNIFISDRNNQIQSWLWKSLSIWHSVRFHSLKMRDLAKCVLVETFHMTDLNWLLYLSNWYSYYSSNPWY